MARRSSSVSVLKVNATVMSSSSAAFFTENFAGTVSVFTGAPGTTRVPLTNTAVAGASALRACELCSSSPTWQDGVCSALSCCDCCCESKFARSSATAAVTDASARHAARKYFIAISPLPRLGETPDNAPPSPAPRLSPVGPPRRSVMNWRRLRSSMGSSPEPAVPAYSRLRIETPPGNSPFAPRVLRKYWIEMRWPLMRFSAGPHERAALCADGPKSAPAALPRPLLQKNLGICELPHVGTEALSANSRRRKGDANACMDNRHRGRDWPDLVGRRDVELGPRGGRLGLDCDIAAC